MATDIDSDAISITSTAPSDPQDEYPVERILAQKTQVNAPTVYLVKWEGYPTERATWEPKESFGDDSTIQEWMKRKARIDKGEEPSFDVGAWEASVRAVNDAKTERKKKRKALRKKRGLPTSSDGEQYSDEEIEKIPKRSTRRRKRRGSESDSGEGEQLKTKGKRVTRKRKQSDSLSEDEEEAIASDDSLLADLKQKHAKQKDARNGAKKRRLQKASAARTISNSETPENTITRETLPEASTRRSLPGSPVQSGPISQRASEVSGGPSPATTGLAGRSRLQPHKTTGRKKKLPREPVEPPPKKPVDIFANVFGPPKPRNLQKPDYTKPYESHKNVTKESLFSTKSMERRFEKAGRNEPEPDITKLQLVDPRTMLRRPTFKLPVDTNPGEEKLSTGLGLFVDEQVASPIEMSAGPRDPVGTPIPQETNIIAVTEPINAAPTPVTSSRPAEDNPEKKKTIKLVDYILGTNRKVDNGVKDKETSEKEQIITAKTPVHEVLDLTMGSMPLTFEGLAEEDDYQRMFQKALDVADIDAEIELGPSQVKIGSLRLLGAKREMRQRLNDLFEGIWLNKMFTAADFKKLWDASKTKILTQGNVKAIDGSAVEGISNYLRLYGSAGVHVRGQFALVLYPANTEPWQFLKTAADNKASELKWMVFDVDDFDAALPGSAKISSQEAKKSGTSLVGWRFVRLSLATRTVYNRLFNMKFEIFVPPSPSSKVNPKLIIFVMVDNVGAFNDFVLLSHWLKGFSMNVYWSGIKGSWENFTNVAERGIVLIHSNFCRFGLDSVPKLGSILGNNDRSINTFEFGRPHTLNPDGQTIQVSKGFQCTRLFPFGGAVLLTDDLFANHPASVLSMLKWYRWQLSRAQTGAWKLVVRGGNVVNWASQLFAAKVDENTESTEVQKLRANVLSQLQELMYKPPGNTLNDPNWINVLQIGSDDGSEPTDPLQQVVLLSLLAHEDYTKFRRFVAISQTPIEGAEKYGVIIVQTSEEFIQGRSKK